MSSPHLPKEQRPVCCGRPMMVHCIAQSGLPRYQCSQCKFSTTGSGDSQYEDAYLGYDYETAANRHASLQAAIRNGANRFVITAATNNTPVNSPAWRALRNLCRDRGAHLIVIPIHYKNVSLYQSAQAYDKRFAPSVLPYIIDQPLRLGHKTWVQADIKIQATAANPLAGMQPLAGANWTIFGHSQMAMEPIATPLTELPGRMYTTGAITQPNYSRTKAGAKAKFHHVIGALLVEVQGRKTFIRQLNADSSGAIHDLTDRYTSQRVRRDIHALSVTTGDEHVKWMKPTVKRATYLNEDSLVRTTRPKYLVRHDVLDGYAGSHHHEGDYRVQYRKHIKQWADYRAELDQVVGHINETTPTDWECVNAMVNDSNHHDHLQNWLNRADDRKDQVNADLICELRNAQREAIREGRDDNAFRLYLEPRLTVPTIYLDPCRPFMLAGVDHSQHGHRGANGARGSARSLANTTHKMTIGHSHSARIVKSVYQGGKSCGVLEYESGLSAHTTTHVLQYQNGKRTMIDILGLTWRATNEAADGGLEIEPDSVAKEAA